MALPFTATELRADCARCVGLCCVGPTFSRGADFALDKPAGTPCPHLDPAFRCAIHDELRPRGFRGCTVYDCFGAGQRISAQTSAGADWRADPSLVAAMTAALNVARPLHELAWYLTEAVSLPVPDGLAAALRDALERTAAFAALPRERLLRVDVVGHRAAVNELLLEASEAARAQQPGARADHRHADWIGADLRGADLRAACLRGARLIAADLRDADLRGADLTGVDLRDADLRGADLTAALFLHPASLRPARGDERTRLSPGRERPEHW